jgi:carbohydrate-binding DOMON domain-containing protein
LDKRMATIQPTIRGSGEQFAPCWIIFRGAGRISQEVWAHARERARAHTHTHTQTHTHTHTCTHTHTRACHRA